MDAIVIIAIALVLYLRNLPTVKRPATRKPKVVKIEPNPMLNPEMHHDENAFMRIANELDFY